MAEYPQIFPRCKWCADIFFSSLFCAQLVCLKAYDLVSDRILNFFIDIFPLVILEWMSGILMKMQIPHLILWKNLEIGLQMKTFMGKSNIMVDEYFMKV